jgi:hypothetical protein
MATRRDKRDNREKRDNRDNRDRVSRDAAAQPIDVRTVELEDEDGNPVVIAQQNVGPDNQVGDGEFKTPRPPKDPGEAADEQASLPQDHSPRPSR